MKKVVSIYSLYIFVFLFFGLHLLNINYELYDLKSVLIVSLMVFLPTSHLSAYFEKKDKERLFMIFQSISTIGYSCFFSGCLVFVFHILKGV